MTGLAAPDATAVPLTFTVAFAATVTGVREISAAASVTSYGVVAAANPGDKTPALGVRLARLARVVVVNV